MLTVEESQKKFPIGSQWHTRDGGRAVIVGHETNSSIVHDYALNVWYDNKPGEHLNLDGNYARARADKRDLISPWKAPLNTRLIKPKEKPMPTPVSDKKLAAQLAEFDAMCQLANAWAVLTSVAVVDDDYPRVRANWEAKLRHFRSAMAANGRETTPPTHGPVTTQSRSVLQDWVMELPLRYQGVLLAAVRGCDTVPKESSAKPITRGIRHAFMIPADPREVGMPSSFTAPLTEAGAKAFLKDWDHYPVHFIQHIMHAAQIIGYCCPDVTARNPFAWLYLAMVDKLHLAPEHIDAMEKRLTEDRIAVYGNATGEME